MGFDMPRDEEPDKEEYEKWEKERPGWNVGDDIFFLSDDETKVVCCKVIEVSEYGMVSEELPRLYPDCQLTISSSLHPKAFHRYEDAAARCLYRGFSEAKEDEGFLKLTRHLRRSAAGLLRDLESGD
jgi:hypothetical protein